MRSSRQSVYDFLLPWAELAVSESLSEHFVGFCA